MTTVLEEHGARDIRQVANWADVAALPTGVCAIADFGLDEGFETDTLAVVSEQDILGDRMVRRQRRKRADNFLTEAASLSVGDHVVHVEHGIGRFEGLQTIDVDGAPHDCLKLVYHADARLFLPVENIELLSRFGGDDMSVTLDKIGGGAWQMRKAKLKEKLNIIAEELIKTAAARPCAKAKNCLSATIFTKNFAPASPLRKPKINFRPLKLWWMIWQAASRWTGWFVAMSVSAKRRLPCVRRLLPQFPAGRWRLSHRPRFWRASTCKLLLRASRICRWLCASCRVWYRPKMRHKRAGLADGEVDIIIGTHALLSKNISFKRLGLVVVDEEQHFGVAHKERLKNLRNEVHVLTLTATPIPRTLQMAMTGVRDLSIIATPPVDRLAVRTYVSPFDAVSLREALLREKYRAGQSFIIVPRISDITEITDFLSEDVPEVSFITAHGQMSGGDLEDRMTAFYQGLTTFWFQHRLSKAVSTYPRSIRSSFTAPTGSGWHSFTRCVAVSGARKPVPMPI